MSAVVLCPFAELAPSSARRFDCVDSTGTAHRIAVVRIVDDLYALADTCSHADVSLSEGTVWDEECEIECWKHGSMFSLKTGEPTTFPATRPVHVYAIARVGDGIVVELP